MQSYADLVLYNADGQVAALVEVKKRGGTDSEWAALFRRNLLAHGGLPRSEFFLLVTPEWIYLWRSAGVEPVVVPPDFVVSAEPFLEPYLARVSTSPEQLSGAGFEQVVGMWLADLSRSEPQSLPRGSAALGELRDSGLLDAASGGWIEHDAAA